jgi:hypothetical protein
MRLARYGGKQRWVSHLLYDSRKPRLRQRTYNVDLLLGFVLGVVLTIVLTMVLNLGIAQMMQS